jgi:hypothetical protein
VDGKTHFHGRIEHMTLIAACGLANDKHLAKLLIAITFDLGLD